MITKAVLAKQAAKKALQGHKTGHAKAAVADLPTKGLQFKWTVAPADPLLPSLGAQAACRMGDLFIRWNSGAGRMAVHLGKQMTYIDSKKIKSLADADAFLMYLAGELAKAPAKSMLPLVARIQAAREAFEAAK